ncbi:hypothetical protein N9933_03390, partial [bacterium]|nr:hypothetical protein [bacterium]
MMHKLLAGSPGITLALLVLLVLLALPTQVNAQVGRDINQDILIDTTRRDSGLIPRPERTILPDTRLVFPELLFAHKAHIKPTPYNLSRQHYFDKRDSVPGFHQTLGQVGKPFQAFRYGFESRYLGRKNWRNPVYGRYNPYVVNPQNDIPYFDTKTPYVNLNYAQGGRKLQQIDGVFSQNISPELNFSTLYQSRKSDGAY